MHSTRSTKRAPRRTPAALGSTSKQHGEALALECEDLGIEARRIRPYTPRTNGKVERFNRTLLDEWAYVRPYRSNAQRLSALARWLHGYNHRRCHTALGGQPPMSRINNVSRQHN
jgi:transposase InsO family protein